MNKKLQILRLTLLIIAFVGCLFAALGERIMDGGPIHYPQLFLAIIFFVIFVIAIAVSRDKAGPPKF